MATDYFEISNRSPELKILSMISSVWIFHIIQFAVKKDIFGRIAKGYNTIEKLSLSLKLSCDILSRLLKGLEHLSLIVKNNNNYEVTDLGQLLLPENDSGFYSMASLWGEEFYNAWSKIVATTEQDKPGFELFYNQNLFEYLKNNSSRAKIFNSAMNSLAKFLYPTIAEYIRLKPQEIIADIGGGNGFLIASILNKNPYTKGILFDLKQVVYETNEYHVHLMDRLQIISGNFFDDIPAADVYIMANVLHDWSDDKARLILQNIKKKHCKNGKLYIVEMALNHEQEPFLAVSTDLNMLMLTGGKERTLSEFKELLGSCNYQIEKVTNVLNVVCLIEAHTE